MQWAISGTVSMASISCVTVKPKAKNVEWEEPTWSYEDEEWYDQQWESEEYEASKSKKGKGKGPMMSTKSKPTWRHSTWNGTDYMICTVVEPQKKLLVFRAGKWLRGSGHYAKTMKNFTLHFDTDDQCDTLDGAWFGEMWFPVQKHTYHVSPQSLMIVEQIRQSGS